MARNFNELRAQMSPASRARADARTEAMLQGILLSELRKLSGMTQVQLARALGIKQPTLSKLEAQNDIQISTLARIIHALGGQLEITASMPTGRLNLKQFKNPQHRKSRLSA